MFTKNQATKCKAENCKKEEVALGLCWDHACKLGDILSNHSPKDLLESNGIMPDDIPEEKRLETELNRGISAHIGHVTLRRLGWDGKGGVK